MSQNLQEKLPLGLKSSAQWALLPPTHQLSLISVHPSLHLPSQVTLAFSQFPSISSASPHLLFLLPGSSMSIASLIVSPLTHGYCPSTQEKLRLPNYLLQRTHHKQYLFYLFPPTCFLVYCVSSSLKYKLDQYQCSYV